MGVAKGDDAAVEGVTATTEADCMRPGGTGVGAAAEALAPAAEEAEAEAPD